MKKDKSFKKYLQEEIGKTDVIDMEKELQKTIPKTSSEEATEDFLKKKLMQQEKRKQYFPVPDKDQVALYEKIQKESSSPLQMGQEKNINKIEDIIKQADLTSPSDMAMVEKLNKLKIKQSPLTKKDLPKVPSILKKGKGKLGLLTSLIGGGISMMSPESKAAELIEKTSEAANKLDPSTYLQESIEDFDKKFAEMQRKKQEEKELAKSIQENSVEEPLLLGEQEAPDLEEMDKVMNYSDYLKKKKRQMGYE